MDLQNIRLGFIGAGNMAAAILYGILKNGFFNSRMIYTYDVNIEKRNELCNLLDVNAVDSNIELVKKSNIIILAVKPAFMEQVLCEVRDSLNDNHLLISIAAGISTEFLKEKTAGRCKVIRVMPNTPALVGEGMTAVCKDPSVPGNLFDLAVNVFKNLGRVEVVDEKYIDAITAISGSSPAYVFMFIEALADGAVLMGLPRDMSYRMAAQAVLGSAKMVLETGKHPGELKDNVCSPGGTTIEAVHVLEQNSFRSAIIDAVKECTLKSKSLGGDKGKNERG